jgi:large subunit ribosomal protein L20
MWSLCRSLRDVARVGLQIIKPIRLNHTYQLKTTTPKISFPQIQVRTMASKKHKKIIKQAKGFRGRANRVYSVAFHRVLKAKQYAYRDRKVKKRDMRSLWIMRINAATRIYGLPYSTFIYYLNTSHISLNRKVLSELAITEPLSFRAVVEVLKDTSGLIQRRRK